MKTGLEAIVALREGKAVRRQNWLKNTVVRVIDGELWFERNNHKWPAREHACSMQHLLHDDWEILE